MHPSPALPEADSRSAAKRGEIPPRVSRLLLLGAAALLLLIYAPGFARGPYVDDNPLLFSNSFVVSSQNPTLFWIRGELASKSWPLTYTVYWLLYRLFGTSFWAYRALNLFVHWTIGALLFGALGKRIRFSSAALVSCLFWFHPLAVEPVGWIAQLNTLLSTLLLFFWLAQIETPAWPRKKDWAYFAGMLVAKGYAFFLPLVVLRKRPPGTSWRATAVGVAALAAVGYAMFVVNVGIYHNPHERWVSRTYTVYGGVTPLPSPLAPGIPPAQRAAEFVEYFAGKLTACGKTATYYFFRILYYGDFSESDLKMPSLVPYNPFFFLLGIGVVFLLAGLLYRRSFFWATGLLVYLPVSGIFYVPFMKYTLVGDRMIYPTYLAFLFGAGLLFDRLENPYLRKLFWLYPLLLGAIAYYVAREPRVVFPLTTLAPS
jgi:hypothetical protein